MMENKESVLWFFIAKLRKNKFSVSKNLLHNKRHKVIFTWQDLIVQLKANDYIRKSWNLVFFVFRESELNLIEIKFIIYRISD